jgi:hypothetical protein
MVRYRDNPFSLQFTKLTASRLIRHPEIVGDFTAAHREINPAALIPPRFSALKENQQKCRYPFRRYFATKQQHSILCQCEFVKRVLQQPLPKIRKFLALLLKVLKLEPV